jgi:dolichol-phosphate mannosyltransferase
MDSERLNWKVSVVVPALNEAETLDGVLRGLEGRGDEIFVIDGHSTDGTREVADAHGVTCHLDAGRGKGEAVRMALRIAAHPIVLFIDADGSHEPADIARLVEPIRLNTADLVVGSRVTGGSDEYFSDIFEFIRYSGSMVINVGINYRWGVRLTDTQNGFRAVRRDVGLSLGLTSDDTCIEQEMVMKALNLGYRVLNVPSHEYQRKGGRSKVVVRKVWHLYVWNVLRHILTPRRNNRLGRAADR